MLETELMDLNKGKIPESAIEDYLEAWESHKATGKAGEKKVIIRAKTV